MTAEDKGELIVYINYLRARGEENRREARKNKYAISNWLMGCGNARIQIAEELEKFIEYTERNGEIKPEGVQLVELDGTEVAKHTSDWTRKYLEQQARKGPHGSGTSKAIKPAGRLLKHIRTQQKRVNA